MFVGWNLKLFNLLAILYNIIENNFIKGAENSVIFSGGDKSDLVGH